MSGAKKTISTSMDLMSALYSPQLPHHMNENFVPANQMLFMQDSGTTAHQQPQAHG